MNLRTLYASKPAKCPLICPADLAGDQLDFCPLINLCVSPSNKFFRSTRMNGSSHAGNASLRTPTKGKGAGRPKFQKPTIVSAKKRKAQEHNRKAKTRRKELTKKKHSFEVTIDELKIELKAFRLKRW